MNSQKMSTWTIFDHPADFPDTYVARRFEIGHGPEPVMTDSYMCSTDLDRLREELLLMGLTCFARDEGDDSVIIETWL